MTDFEQAKKKIESVMMMWFETDTVMLNVMCLLNKKPDPSQETMGLDIRGSIPTLTYNPNFVNSISKERLELIMASEGFKVLLRHATTRLKDPKQISALASSITINQLMNSNIKNILAGLDDYVPSPEKYGLNENSFYEQYFRDLMDKVEKINEQIKQIWNSLSDEKKEELINGSVNKGQSDNTESKDENGYKQFGNSKSALKEYYNPNGTSNNGWGRNDLFDAEVKSFIDEKKNNNLRNWGKFTGDTRSIIIAANEPKISCREIVRRFYKSTISSQVFTSRMKVNRRYDLLCPGYNRKYKSKIIFGVDVSGSMSDDDLREGFAIINSCLKHSEIIYVQFDTEIKSVEYKLNKAKQSFQVHGRGGTNFDALFEMANNEKCDGIVVYTDGIADVPKKPNAKVLWLLTDRNKNRPDGCNFGEVAYLDRFENAHTV